MCSSPSCSLAWYGEVCGCGTFAFETSYGNHNDPCFAGSAPDGHSLRLVVLAHPLLYKSQSRSNHEDQVDERVWGRGYRRVTARGSASPSMCFLAVSTSTTKARFSNPAFVISRSMPKKAGHRAVSERVTVLKL